ncbi:MAG: SAM-dependent methyltransferase, partial [Bacteroidota bacterium]
LKDLFPEKDIAPLHFSELDKHDPKANLGQFLEPCRAGHDLGLLSEAGLPGIADPGGGIVALAHQEGIPVVPLTGPSSILLALIASGMNGQQFTFHGYLPRKGGELQHSLQRLEQEARRTKATQIWIETPYRNQAMIDTVLKQLSPNTHFAVAANLSLPSVIIRSTSITHWRKLPALDIQKQPAVFLLNINP